MRRIGRIEGRLRRVLNPLSTGLTRWWLGVGRRRVPGGNRPLAESGSDRPRAFFGVASPGEWVAPPGMRPGWDWLPEYGASPRLRQMPRWVRVWFRVPFVDRFAYEWMWWHGGWSVLVPADSDPPDDGQAGIR